MNVLEEAASRLSVDVDALVAGGLARGRRLRRQRRALVGVGSVAAVAVLGAGSVWVGQSLGSSGTAVAPADGSPSVVVPPSPTFSATLDTKTGERIPPSALEHHTMYTGPTDAPLTKDADQIHAALATMLPAGDVGPILTPASEWPKVSDGSDRIEHFTYNGSLVSFIINAAKGFETCESVAATAVAQSGYHCDRSGALPVLTESTPGPGGLNSVTVWHHGYEVTVMSYAAGPSDQPNPAMDGKKMQHVSDQPPLSVDQLTQIATSGIWFQ